MTYEIHAIRYGQMDRMRRDNFLHLDDHDGPMPLDFFIWVITGDHGTFVVDTGFDQTVADRRNRTLLRPIHAALEATGTDPATVKDVIITHLHWDHAGNHDLFPQARYHLQEKEMAFATGPCMCNHTMNRPFEVEDVQHMVKRVFEGRVCFHDGSKEIAPGLSLHWVGGHSGGLQVVRVKTRRGWVVLASDATHYYENFEKAAPFPIVANVGDAVRAFRTLRELATSDAHVIPGHDPLVLQRYPSSGLGEGIVRLDADPV
ncbi:N-acyl homoserine lactonase family protein [Pseudooceanicola sp. C21-150M6]|uniref:N-acyl homoserine lactonase family protein n=1 Tax=Pseudooceanicola sp. C21-150M6 TaxID=3434355 RepID=UPI003D7F53C8